MKDYADFGIRIPYGRTSGEVKTICPQCHDRRTDKRDRSLSVNLDKGIWNCHYCGWSGTVHDSEFDDSPEGRRKWMERQPWYRQMSPIRQQKPVYKKPAPKPASPMSAKALAWFESRGISEATLQALNVTEGMEWMPQKQGEANTVQFNYYLNGELVNTKFRTGDKCFKLVQGAELIPYNIDSIKGQKECIITEGEMDALSFYEIGFHNVVSVPNGANANLEYLDNFIEDYFDDKDTIFIASDTDTKGVLLRDELLRRFGAERCRVLDYGEDCKDANEVLMKHGAEALGKCLNDAPEIKLEGVFTVSDFEQSLDALFENGMQRGVTVGHSNLDRLISFETKRLCIVTGIPGSGKSEFIDEIAERLNMRYGWRFAYFSPENFPLAYHASKLIEKFTGRKFSRTDLSVGEYRQAKEHMERSFFFIAPENSFKLATILEKARFLVRRYGIKSLVIDPYNRLENEQGSQNETQYVSGVLDKLTNFAQLNDVLVILMAHPTKMQKDKNGNTEVPSLYDISGSANFYNKADFGITVHRHRAENTVEVRVLKVKFRHLGETGSAFFKYNLRNGRYTPCYGIDDSGQVEWDNTNHLTEALREGEATAQTDISFEYMPPADSSLPFGAPSDDTPF